MKTKQNRIDEAGKVYLAIEYLAGKAYHAKVDPAWKVYEAKLREIDELQVNK